jgi:hypothetical protein
MSGALLVELTSDPLERSEVDLVAAGFFCDERPLRDAAATIDWRFCGLLSEGLTQGWIAGKRGEAILLPTYGRMHAPRVLLLGLGRRADYRLSHLVEASRDAILRSLGLGARSLALAPLGIAPDDFPRNADSMLSAALTALEEAGSSLRVRVALPESELARASRALEDMVSSGTREGLIFRRSAAPRPPRQALPLGIGPGL